MAANKTYNVWDKNTLYIMTSLWPAFSIKVWKWNQKVEHSVYCKTCIYPPNPCSLTSVYWQNLIRKGSKLDIKSLQTNCVIDFVVIFVL